MFSRVDWLKERKKHLGGSDVAAVLGMDARRGPFEVYVSKVSDCLDDTDNEWLQYGRDIEGAIANFYQHKTGRVVQDLGATEFQYHKDIPWLAVTLDRTTDADDRTGRAPLELKSEGNRSPWQWREETPEHQLIQLQTQMACTGAQWGTLAALFPGYQLEYIDMDYSGLIEAAYPILDEFWQRVQRRDPPEPMPKQNTLDVVKRFYKPVSGKTTMLDDELQSVVNRWEVLKKIRNRRDKQIQEHEALIRAALGDAELGRFIDGSTVSLKTVTVNHKPKDAYISSYTKLGYKGK